MALTVEQANALVEQHLDVATKAARTVFPRVRSYVSFEELEAIGRQGLVEAAPRFDPSRGTFAAFAWYRAYGAIVDALRKSQTMPRTQWAKLTALRASNDYLEQQSAVQRNASNQDQTVAALTAVKNAIASIKAVYLTSLDAASEKGFDVASEAPNARDETEAKQQSKAIANLIQKLPTSEQAIIRKMYYEEKSLTDASAELGLSKSWGSRVHAQAVERLREFLDDED